MWLKQVQLDDDDDDNDDEQMIDSEWHISWLFSTDSKHISCHLCCRENTDTRNRQKHAHRHMLQIKFSRQSAVSMAQLEHSRVCVHNHITDKFTSKRHVYCPCSPTLYEGIDQPLDKNFNKKSKCPCNSHWTVLCTFMLPLILLPWAKVKGHWNNTHL